MVSSSDESRRCGSPLDDVDVLIPLSSAGSVKQEFRLEEPSHMLTVVELRLRK
jgi:hypothetical protein